MVHDEIGFRVFFPTALSTSKDKSQLRATTVELPFVEPIGAKSLVLVTVILCLGLPSMVVNCEVLVCFCICSLP